VRYHRWNALEVRSPASNLAVVKLRGLLAATLFAPPIFAHERWLKHDLKHPLQAAFFGRWPAYPLSMQPSMLRIGINAFVVLAACLAAWFGRNIAIEWLQQRVLVPAAGRVQRALDEVVCFFADRPVRNRVFRVVGEWSVVLFLRSPGLVLMYSATNDSLVMPSYPLDPASATFFKFAQVALAILILTETALPLCGALIIGTWLYLFGWGWMVTVDALPVLTVAAVYVTSPWYSHKLAITSLTPAQTRVTRVILGFAFMALGWMKIYNYNLIAGVADNYPSAMNDPMINFFALGTEAMYRRETWVVAFGLAEVLSGFMMMIGVFVRGWGVVMIFIFTKLMLVDFGWDEIPHIYPIAALLAIVFSNHLRSELAPIEERVRRESRTALRLAEILVPAGALAALVIFPLLWLLTFRSGP
jgi:hypothetical protein